MLLPDGERRMLWTGPRGADRSWCCKAVLSTARRRKGLPLGGLRLQQLYTLACQLHQSGRHCEESRSRLQMCLELPRAPNASSHPLLHEVPPLTPCQSTTCFAPIAGVVAGRRKGAATAFSSLSRSATQAERPTFCSAAALEERSKLCAAGSAPAQR